MMKPVYLEFCGLNSFSEKAKIDFKSLLSGGVFGIFGDTGSGKSTILDAIHFALYGEVQRVPKSFNDCINYRSDGAWVIFDYEITIEGVRHTYRVKRERKRKANTSKAYLYELIEKERWLAIAEGTREVDAKIEAIIGLSFADFKMCIALPQGDFSALVKATAAERVKLVARLFNLERYGERLSKRINEGYFKAEEQVNLITARMEENQEASEEQIALLSEQIQVEKTNLKSLQKEKKLLDDNYQILLDKHQAFTQWQALNVRLEKLKNSFAFMQEQEKKIQLYPKAKALLEKYALLEKTQQNLSACLQKIEKLKLAYATIEKELQQEKTTQSALNYDEEILNLSVAIDSVIKAEGEIQFAQKAKQKYEEAVIEYKNLCAVCVEEDFVKQKNLLEEELLRLGEDDTLLDYLKRHAKTIFLVDAYGEFRLDLCALAKKYPQVETDVEKLLTKYSIQQDGLETTLDVTAINLKLKETEQKKKNIKTQLESLEKRRLAYESNEERKKLCIEKGKLLHESYLQAEEKIASIKKLGSKTDLAEKLKTVRLKKKTMQDKIDTLQNQLNESYAQIQAQSKLVDKYKEDKTTQKQAFDVALNDSLLSVSQAQTLVNALVDIERIKEQVKAFFDEYNALTLQTAESDGKQFEDYSITPLQNAKNQIAQLQDSIDEKNREIGAKEKEYNRLLTLQERYKEMQKELKVKTAYKNLYDTLRSLVRSNKFLDFIACEYLQDISLSASKTLLSLTSGRYFLVYDKEFKVGDNLDGGSLRGVKTLSGGETFLVSLSLALSLSGAICVKSLRPIEFFFLDEGFGTLDGKLVDIVMDVLSKLSKNFCVGLISHVEELKHRIDHKILVTGATDKAGSKIKIECF